MDASDDLIQRLKQERDKALEETNAQAVFESLVKVRETRQIHPPRWIWEPLQNAADATDPLKSKNRVKVCAEQNQLHFTHCGSAFKSQEITHLVYHGSTKQGDESKKGKFGS